MFWPFANVHCHILSAGAAPWTKKGSMDEADYLRPSATSVSTRMAWFTNLKSQCNSSTSSSHTSWLQTIVVAYHMSPWVMQPIMRHSFVLRWNPQRCFYATEFHTWGKTPSSENCQEFDGPIPLLHHGPRSFFRICERDILADKGVLGDFLTNLLIILLLTSCTTHTSGKSNMASDHLILQWRSTGVLPTCPYDTIPYAFTYFR